MLILIIVALVACGGGMYGSYRAGRRTERISGVKAQKLLTEGARTEFDRLLDESRICVGELQSKTQGEGPLFGQKLYFAGLHRSNLSGFSTGTLIAASWQEAKCDRCKGLTHFLIEVAERTAADGKNEKFARHLCTVCLTSGCGRIVHLSANDRSERYGALIDASANAQDLLERVRELRESLPFDALEAKATPVLPNTAKTETS